MTFDIVASGHLTQVSNYLINLGGRLMTQNVKFIVYTFGYV